MQRLTTLLLCLLPALTVVHADVYVMTKDSRYTNNQVISAGINKPFPMKEYKDALRNGQRLIAAGYTRLNGWVLSMAEGSGIRLQHVSTSTEWPVEWIEGEWNDGYMINAVGHGDGQWVVVTSLNCGLSQQVAHTAEGWDLMRLFIKEQWESSDRRITSLCSNGGNQWAVVMSFADDSNGGQRYDFKNTWRSMSPIVDHYFANDYFINSIAYGQRNVGVVFNRGDGETTPRQVCVTDPMSIPEYI